MPTLSLCMIVRDEEPVLARCLGCIRNIMDEIIIVDTGAGISDAVLEFLVASGEILLVTTPEPTSITDSYSLLKALSRHDRFAKDKTQIKVISNLS